MNRKHIYIISALIALLALTPSTTFAQKKKNKDIKGKNPETGKGNR